MEFNITNSTADTSTDAVQAMTKRLRDWPITLRTMEAADTLDALLEERNVLRTERHGDAEIIGNLIEERDALRTAVDRVIPILRNRQPDKMSDVIRILQNAMPARALKKESHDEV